MLAIYIPISLLTVFSITLSMNGIEADDLFFNANAGKEKICSAIKNHRYFNEETDWVFHIQYDEFAEANSGRSSLLNNYNQIFFFSCERKYELNFISFPSFDQLKKKSLSLKGTDQLLRYNALLTDRKEFYLPCDKINFPVDSNRTIPKISLTPQIQIRGPGLLS